jgi:hypothetical protein
LFCADSVFAVSGQQGPMTDASIALTPAIRV